MKKLIIIKGELDEKGSTAHTLNTMAADEGKSLSQFIKMNLDSVAGSLEYYTDQLTKPLYIEVPHFDYTEDGTEYKYDGEQTLELEKESAIEFSLKIQGLENDLDIQLSDLIIWKDGSEEETLTEDEKEIVYDKLRSLIQTNLV